MYSSSSAQSGFYDAIVKVRGYVHEQAERLRADREAAAKVKKSTDAVLTRLRDTRRVVYGELAEWAVSGRDSIPPQYAFRKAYIEAEDAKARLAHAQMRCVRTRHELAAMRQLIIDLEGEFDALRIPDDESNVDTTDSDEEM